MSSSCARVRGLLAEFALDVLEEPRARDVRGHLDGCAGCRKEAEGLLEGAARLAATLPVAPPPVELRDRVIASLAVARAGDAQLGPGARPPAPARRASRRTVRIVAAAALAAAILAGGSFSWAIAMRGQVHDLQQARARQDQTVRTLQRFVADFNAKFRHLSNGSNAEKMKFFGALLAAPTGSGGSGEVLVFSIPGQPDFVHMQANLPPTAKGPFRVYFEQGAGEPILAGGLVKTPNQDYVLSKDPRFFDQDLSHITTVVVLDRGGATVLTGSIQLVTTASP